MIAFPPHQTKASIGVSQATALAHLTNYLTSSETQPHLLPNAHLDPSTGPTVGSSNFSVTIHNLRRVQAGLRGERLAPTLELKECDHNSTTLQTDLKLTDTGEKKYSCFPKATITKEEAQVVEHTQDSNQSNIRKQQPSNSDWTNLSDSKPEPNYVDKEARKREKKARRKALKKVTQKIARNS